MWPRAHCDGAQTRLKRTSKQRWRRSTANGWMQWRWKLTTAPHGLSTGSSPATCVKLSLPAPPNCLFSTAEDTASCDALFWQVTYGHECFGSESLIIGSLCHTIGSLLRSGGRRACGCDASGSRPADEVSDRPRVILAHEHRARDSGLPWLREELSRWDEGDEHIESVQAAAAAEGLVLRPLWCERPVCVHRNEFHSWTADLSVFEVLLQEDQDVK